MKTFADSSKTEYERAELELKTAQKNYEALCCGLAVDGDENLGSIQDQLINLTNQISQLSSQIKQAQMKLKSAIEENQKLSKELSNSTKDYNDMSNEFNSKKLNYEKAKVELDKVNYDSRLMEELLDKRRDLNSNYELCRDRVDSFYSRYPHLNFEYKINQPNFDTSRIKGLVCNLFRIKDLRFATALETTAGGKLYNVVVDTDQTGKILLESGSLKRKVTIIPMNKIKPNVVSERVVKAAKEIVGHDLVFNPLTLIEFDPAYKSVMEYVFGNKLICASLVAAKQVAFNPQIMTNAVTLEGDHFDPEGVLSGGSKGERGNVLARLVELNEDRAELDAFAAEMRRLEHTLSQEKLQLGKYTQLKREMDEHLSKMNSAKACMEQTSYHQKLERKQLLDDEIEQKKLDINKFELELQASKEKHAKLNAKNQTQNKEEEKLAEQRTIDEKKIFIEKHLKSINKFQKVSAVTEKFALN